MTKRIYVIAGAMMLAAQLQSASAQSVFSPSPAMNGATAPRPALSPYLNLLRGGDPAANYYLGVLPEQDRRYQLTVPQNFNGQTPFLDQYVDDRVDMDLRERQLLPTGHSTGFMIYNAYYRIPNERSFLPYNPYNTNSGTNRQQMITR